MTPTAPVAATVMVAIILGASSAQAQMITGLDSDHKGPTPVEAGLELSAALEETLSRGETASVGRLLREPLKTLDAGLLRPEDRVALKRRLAATEVEIRAIVAEHAEGGFSDLEAERLLAGAVLEYQAAVGVLVRPR
jgi:hypothetical protein